MTTYTRVGSAKGSLTIGGAEKKMQEDSTFTYVSKYHVAGPLSEVEGWLKETHPTEDTSKVLLSSYNMKNLKKSGVRKAFVTELEEWQQVKEQKSRERQEERQINLLILVELLKRYQEQRKETGVETEKKTGRKTLRDKLSEVVGAGKVMDVTRAQEKGKGISRVTVSKQSVKRRLAQDENDALYNVVYNPHSEVASQGVRNFLVEYGGFSDEQVDTIVSAVSSGAEVEVTRTITPTATTNRPSSPLTKRFTSPLRRNQDSSVDDLLEGLN